MIAAKFIDWDEAPEWAQWRARGEDGTLIYFEQMPTRWKHGWDAPGRWLTAYPDSDGWERSLEARP